MAEDKNAMKYCGVNKVPNGKVRGTPEYCVQTNQVRYYGLHKINESLLTTAKGKTSDLIKQQLRAKKYMDDAKILNKEYLNAKIILEESKKESEKKNARKKMANLQDRFEKLKLKAKKQLDLVKRLQETEKIEREAEEKTAKKVTKKATKKTSGSKTAKKKPVRKAAAKKKPIKGATRRIPKRTRK